MLSGTETPGHHNLRTPRAEAVGALPRSDAVTAAARRGSLADQEVLDDAMIDTVRLQEEAGLDVITDGEVRRTSWNQTPRFLDCFTTFPERSTGCPGTSTGFPGTAPGFPGRGGNCPVLTGRVRDAARIGDMAADYQALARYLKARSGTSPRGTSPRAKFALPAPSYHRRYWSGRHSRAVYGSVEEYLAEIRDYLHEVVDRLVGLGCDYIQLDAPNYGALCDPEFHACLASEGRDPRAELAFDAELDSSLLDGLEGVTTALHICRAHGGHGHGGHGHGPDSARRPGGGYGEISGDLFPRLRFDRLLLDYGPGLLDYGPGHGGFEPLNFEALKDIPAGTVAVLGLVSPAATPAQGHLDASAAEARAARLRAAQARAAETRAEETRADNAWPAEDIRSAGARAEEIQPTEFQPAEARPAETWRAETWPAEIRANEVRAAEAQTAEAAIEDRIAEASRLKPLAELALTTQCGFPPDRPDSRAGADSRTPPGSVTPASQ
ncbi:MAG: hypothetical protein J2P26_14815, partial [Nocardiopsaceae bacterium]|nr:hypothetical protein [Nocardiopsaceae bacterium]